MLSRSQLEMLTSLVNGDLALLERKYRALPLLELWENLIAMFGVDCSMKWCEIFVSSMKIRSMPTKQTTQLQHVKRSVSLNRLLRECDA